MGLFGKYKYKSEQGKRLMNTNSSNNVGSVKIIKRRTIIRRSPGSYVQKIRGKRYYRSPVKNSDLLR